VGEVEYSMRCTRTARTLLLAALVVVAAGCAKRLIPNTEVPDNSFNRKVISFCERYRLAVEEKNVGTLLVLASPEYYEDGGTPTGDDDFDFDGLRDVLINRFAKIKTIRYDIKYRKVTPDGDIINVDYTYSASFQVTVAGQDHWFRKVEDNRLVLAQVGEQFKILSGM
jgi:hypothetical protein